MGDDWRLTVVVNEPGRAFSLARRLDTLSLEHELETTFEDRVIVSTDGPELFCYTATREQAEAAERLIGRVAGEQGWVARTVLERWHPEAEAWEAPDRPMPASAVEQAAEHSERIAAQRAESLKRGFPSFEVRVECRTDSDCAAFARRLADEGLPVVRRGRFLLIGADDEDSAQALAARCHEQAPDGSSVIAEGTAPAVLAGAPMNPFAVFGGLGI
jgi:hypothetical protein